LTGRYPRQIGRTAFPALAQRAPPAQVTKQSGIRQSEFIGVEVEREHKAPQQVIGLAARNRGEIAGSRSPIMRQVFEIVGAEASSLAADRLASSSSAATIARTRSAATALVAVKTRASHPPLIGRGLRTKLFLPLLHSCAGGNLRS